MEDRLFIKKNLLDLEMQKYLQLTSTSIIILFSYFIGVFIVFITDQINFTNQNIYRLFILVTVNVLGYTAILFFIGFKKIQRISKAIKEVMDEIT